MAAAPAIESGLLEAVEQLNYRVTVADVAAQAGLDLNLAERGLMVLAASAGGNLQVAESGDVVYVFSRDFRDILRNKFWQLQLQETWAKIWKVLFYLIRLSVGIVLVLLIAAVLVAIVVALVALSSSRDSDSDSGGGGDSRGSGSSSGSWNIGFPIGGGYYGWSDWIWIWWPDYDNYAYQRRREKPDLNFLEAIYSFLFGDGNPNLYLEKERWQLIAQVIRQNQGAVVVEQVAPYLELPDRAMPKAQDLDEDWMLPVLVRFNGHPQVTDRGEIIYQFPDLQTTVQDLADLPETLPRFQSERIYNFSRASSGQRAGAIALGVALLVLSLVLGGLIAAGDAATFGKAYGFLRFTCLLGLGYSGAFLSIPAVRWWVISGRNRAIERRNQQRSALADLVTHPDPDLAHKLAARQQLTQARNQITDRDLTYTTEMDVTEQEALNPEAVDRAWQQRLNSAGSAD